MRRDSSGIVDNLVKRLERLGSRRRKFFWPFFLWRHSFDRHDDARGYSVAVVIDADLDDFETAGEFVALRPIFHKLNRGDDIVRGVAFDGFARRQRQ